MQHYVGNKLPPKINEQQGWYDVIYENLLLSVRGYIRAGFSKNDALVRAFDESTASKGIKHKIEDLIRNETN